jgi:hypothetical protein
VGLEWGSNFSSEQCVEGMVGIQNKNLRWATPMSWCQCYKWWMYYARSYVVIDCEDSKVLKSNCSFW